MPKAQKVVRVSDEAYAWLASEAERLSEELGMNVSLSDAAGYHFKKLIEADEKRVAPLRAVSS